MRASQVRIPLALGYVRKPEDVAGLISYLASDEAHYVTGQSVRSPIQHALGYSDLLNQISIDGGLVFD